MPEASLGPPSGISDALKTFEASVQNVNKLVGEAEAELSADPAGVGIVCDKLQLLQGVCGEISILKDKIEMTRQVSLIFGLIGELNLCYKALSSGVRLLESLDRPTPAEL